LIAHSTLSKQKFSLLFLFFDVMMEIFCWYKLDMQKRL